MLSQVEKKVVTLKDFPGVNLATPLVREMFNGVPGIDLPPIRIPVTETFRAQLFHSAPDFYGTGIITPIPEAHAALVLHMDMYYFAEQATQAKPINMIMFVQWDNLTKRLGINLAAGDEHIWTIQEQEFSDDIPAGSIIFCLGSNPVL